MVHDCPLLWKNVHVSAGVQIGGVLEPIGNIPVIIEDNCFIGAGSILVEGIIIEEGAVIAPGVTISASTKIYDTINHKIIKGKIPQNAVVVQGSKKVDKDLWSEEHNLNINCPIIIKFKDDKTNKSLKLESKLR